MDNDDTVGYNGGQSASKFDSVILDNEWRKHHQGNYVTMGSAVILSSEPTAEEAIRVGNQVAEEEGVRLDFLAKVDRDAQKEARAKRNGLDIA